MAQTPLANLGINYEHTLGADDWKNSYDANWIITDWSLQPWIMNRTTTAEPGSPSVGDAYLLGGTRTGTDWGSDSGSASGSIAIYANIPGLPDSSKWIYLAPREGWTVHDRTANEWMFYTGSAWVQMASRLRPPNIFITAATHEPTMASINATTYINNSAHTLNIPDNATVAAPLGAQMRFVNDHANAITVTDDAAVTWRHQDLVSAGIAGGATAVIEKTGTDEWMVLSNGAWPT